MVTNTYINISTKDVVKARAFFTGLGFEMNEQFSDEQGFCIVVNEKTYLMVVSDCKFENFTKSKIVNSFESNEVIMSFQVSSKDEVNALIEKAVALGGKEFGEANDSEFMYFRSFLDHDGHHFEVFNFNN